MKQSKEFLNIDVTPVNKGVRTEYQINYQVCSGEQSGETWLQMQEELPNAENNSTNLWAKLENAPDDPGQFDEILKSAGLSLYHWLFDLQATKLLNQAEAQARNATAQEQLYLRICLELPSDLAEFPWEAARSEQGLIIGVSGYFTVIRKIKKPSDQKDKSQDPLPKMTPPLRVEVIGVDYKGDADYPDLDTAAEAASISNYANKGHFQAVIDVQGAWSKFKQKCENKQSGPPAIFHFAGHSAKDGAALLFRGDQGKAEPIGADLLADVLAVRKPATVLAFLNACATSARPKRFYLPYHSLAETLVGRGILMTLGVQTPLLDKDARLMARYFYEELSQGTSFDCALQEARRQLWRNGQEHCNWPFIFGMVAHQPYSFRELVNRTGSSRPDITDFGFDRQRGALRRLLARESPTLIVIHGEQRSGHAHLLAQAERELKAKRRSYWEPIPEFLYKPKRVGEFVECELLSHFADRLGLDNSGDVDAVRGRIIEKLESWLQEFEVVVLQFKKPLSLSRRETLEQNHIVQICAALETILIQLKERGNLERISFFFLLPIEYLQLSGQSRFAQRKKQLIQQLENSSRQTLRIQVVEELLPIEDSEIREFLKYSFDLSSEDIERHLERLRIKPPSSWLNRIRSLRGLSFRQTNNETIIEYIKDIIEFNHE